RCPNPTPQATSGSLDGSFRACALPCSPPDRRWIRPPRSSGMGGITLLRPERVPVFLRILDGAFRPQRVGPAGDFGRVEATGAQALEVDRDVTKSQRLEALDEPVPGDRLQRSGQLGEWDLDSGHVAMVAHPQLGKPQRSHEILGAF